MSVGSFWVPAGMQMLQSMSHDVRQIESQATADWLLNAAWNTPANQVSRLREAGLNPNLAYGAVNTGNMSASTRSSNASEHSSDFAKTLNFMSGLASLATAINENKRADQALKLQERAQDLDALKFESALQHQQDAMDLERKRMAVDLAFRNHELSNKERDYQLRKAEFDWRKEQPRGGAAGYVDKLISATLGRSTTDVASDTNRFLNSFVQKIFDWTIVKPSEAASFINSFEYRRKRK